MCSLTSGIIGSFFGTPTDLVLVRMQADRRAGLEESQRRNYKNAFDALYRIQKEEGFTKLWTGCLPTMLRACVNQFWLLVSYEECKERLSASARLEGVKP